MLPLSTDELCSKLNILLTEHNKYVVPIQIEENINEVKPTKVDKLDAKLYSIYFQKYHLTTQEGDQYAILSSAQVDKNSTIAVDSLQDPLKKILTRSKVKRVSESILLQVRDVDPDSTNDTLEQATVPDVFLEVVYPTYTENLDYQKLENGNDFSNNLHVEKKTKGKFSSGRPPLSPTYLKVKEQSTEFVFVRVINPNVKGVDGEELLKAISETLLISDLQSNPSYMKLITPYNVRCQMRYVRSKYTHKEQTLKEFSLLEAVQTSALGGLHIRRYYSENTGKQSRTIPLLMAHEKYKLKHLKNYISKMMPTYLKHEVPEAPVLIRPIPKSVAEERFDVHSWLEQFKS